MKKSKFTEQQIAFLLQQGDGGTSVEEVCRKAGITAMSEPTFPRWIAHPATFDPRVAVFIVPGHRNCGLAPRCVRCSEVFLLSSVKKPRHYGPQIVAL